MFSDLTYSGWASEIQHHQPDGWNPNKKMGCLPPLKQLVQDFSTTHRIICLFKEDAWIPIGGPWPEVHDDVYFVRVCVVLMHTI